MARGIVIVILSIIHFTIAQTAFAGHPMGDSKPTRITIEKLAKGRAGSIQG